MADEARDALRAALAIGGHLGKTLGEIAALNDDELALWAFYYGGEGSGDV